MENFTDEDFRRVTEGLETIYQETVKEQRTHGTRKFGKEVDFHYYCECSFYEEALVEKISLAKFGIKLRIIEVNPGTDPDLEWIVWIGSLAKKGKRLQDYASGFGGASDEALVTVDPNISKLKKIYDVYSQYIKIDNQLTKQKKLWKRTSITFLRKLMD